MLSLSPDTFIPEAKAVLVTAGGIVVLPAVYIAGVEGTSVYLQNPYLYNQIAIDGIGSYLPGVPATSLAGLTGFWIADDQVGLGYNYGELYHDLKEFFKDNTNTNEK